MRRKTVLDSLFCAFQIYEKEASARQHEVGELRRTGEVHRKRVKQLEQELLSQRIIAKVPVLHCAAVVV